MTSATAAPIRVLIVDENRLVRRSLRARLEQTGEVTVIGEASCGRDAILVAHAERADVVLMDLHLRDINGVDATRVIVRGGSPAPRVVILTSDISDAFVVDAFDAGASGYLLKHHDRGQLVAAVRGAAAGTATIISPQMAPRLLRELARLRPVPPDAAAVALLSRAERRVVAVLSGGTTASDDIARALGVSVATVRSQTAAALKKLGLKDRTQLALWGLRNDVTTAGR